MSIRRTNGARSGERIVLTWRGHLRIYSVRSHPLMDSAVRQEGDAPGFYKRDLVLTTLVVDRQFVDMLRDDITYTIFYAGTSKLQYNYYFYHTFRSREIITSLNNQTL